MYDQYGYMPQQPGYMMGRQQKIVRVNGRGGAEAYQMPPNSEALLLDETAAIVWLKTTDGAGYPALNPYTITPYQPEPQVSTSEIMKRLTKLEEIVNGKPDSGYAAAT